MGEGAAERGDDGRVARGGDSGEGHVREEGNRGEKREGAGARFGDEGQAVAQDVNSCGS